MSSSRFSQPAPGLVERLDQVLKDLDSGVLATHTLYYEQELLTLTKIMLTRLRSILKLRLAEEVAGQVRCWKLSEASSAMDLNFPGGSMGSIDDVLELVSQSDDNMTSAIKWVRHLDAQLRPRAFEIIYGHVKSLDHKGLLLMLLMQNEIRSLAVEDCSDDIRAWVDKDCCQLTERFVVHKGKHETK